MSVDAEGESASDVPADIRGAVVSSWFPRAVAAPDSARNRAQAGYAISSAIASTVVAVGAFVDIADRSVEAQVFAALALLCWVATALLYLHAVTTAVKMCQPNVANMRIPRAEVLGVASER